MEADLQDLISEENGKVGDFNGLLDAKSKEIKANTKAIETKLARVGEVAVDLAQMKNDLEDTQEGLAEDKAFLAKTKKTCKEKAAEYEADSKIRSEEMVALSDT